LNCLEFRRAKLAEPRDLSESARAHALNCASCTAFAQSVDDGDAEILRAAAVPVPEGLADRVLLHATGTVRPAWRAWAMAASVVLAVGLATVVFVQSPRESYARLAIEHVVDEPESLTTRYRADGATVEVALRSVGASIRSPLGQVRYIRLCPWEGGRTAWHVVFETPQGLATLILVPDMQVRSESDASASGWNAIVKPTQGGFYAIVTSSPETTARTADLLRTHVNWDA
jgi:hypothetical protein